MPKQYENRERAYENRERACDDFLKGVAMTRGESLLLRHAFNRGWDARKETEYKRAYSLDRESCA